MIKTIVNTIVYVMSGAGNEEILPANDRRIGLVISNNSTGLVFWRFGSPMTAAQQGHAIIELLTPALFPPFKMTYNEFGSGIQQPLNMYTTTVGKVIAITEFLAAP